MTNEGNIIQDSALKRDNFFGSTKYFYIGSTIGSTTAWTLLDFSGTTSKFGTGNDLLSNHIKIVASGGAVVQWTYVSGGATVAGEILAYEQVQLDGVSKSGLWVRSNTASTNIRIWAW